MIRATIFVGVLLVAVSISSAQYQSSIRQGVLGSELEFTKTYIIPQGICDVTKLINFRCAKKLSVEVTVKDVKPYPAIDFNADLKAVMIKRVPGAFGCPAPAIVQVRYTCVKPQWRPAFIAPWKPLSLWKPASDGRAPQNSWKSIEETTGQSSDVVVREDTEISKDIIARGDERRPVYSSDPWILKRGDGIQDGDWVKRNLREITVHKNAKEPKPRDPEEADIVALHKASSHL